MKSITTLVTILFFLASVYGQPGGFFPGFAGGGVKLNKINSAVGLTQRQASLIFTNANADTYTIVPITGGDGGSQLGNLSVYKRTGDGLAVTGYGTNGFSDFYPLASPAAVLLPGGEIVMTGYIPEQRDVKIVLGKITKTGKRDPSFGDGGFVVTDIIKSETSLFISQAANGRLLVFYQDDIPDVGQSQIAAFKSNGQPDAGFGTSGIRQIVTGYESSTLPAFTKMQDGRFMLALGVRESGASVYSNILSRLNTEGNTDNTFGINGVVNIGPVEEGVRLVAITQKPAGGFKILYEINNNLYYTYRVAHHLANGQPDPAFASTLTQVIDFGFSAPFQKAQFQSDGKIVLLVNYGTFSFNEQAVARINGNSEPDLTFNGTAYMLLDRVPDSYYRDIALTPKKNVMTVGSSFSSTASFFLLKIAQAGGYDNYYGAGGMVSVTYKPGHFGWAKLLRMPDGRLVAGGIVQLASGYYYVLGGFTSKGHTDNSFGTQGFTFIPLTDEQRFNASIELAPDGKIFLFKSTIGTVQSLVDLLRFRSDGKPDLSWGSGGQKTIMIDKPVGVATLTVQADNRILIGYTVGIDLLPGDENLWNDRDIGILRLTAAGNPDPSFGTGGTRLIDFDISGDQLYHIKIQHDGKILVIGQAMKFFIFNLAVMRLNSNGTTDESYGTDGKFIPRIRNGFHPNDVTFAKDKKLVIAGRVQDNEFEPMAGVVQINTDGSLDLGFAEMGLFREGFITNRTEALTVNIQKDGRIVLVAHDAGQYLQEVALIRLRSNGERDESFGTAGIQRLSYSLGWDFFSDAIIQDNLLVMAGSTDIPASTGILAAVWLHQPSQLLTTTQETSAKVLEGISGLQETRVYPNPTSGFTYLYWNKTGQNIQQVDLVDMQGKVLRSWSNVSDGTNIMRLELGNAKPGTYIITIRDRSGSIERRKLIVGK